MLIVDDAISEVPIQPDVFMNVAVPSSLPYYNADGGGHCNKLVVLQIEAAYIGIILDKKKSYDRFCC